LEFNLDVPFDIAVRPHFTSSSAACVSRHGRR
jgi:hypothetical protein